MTVTVVVRVTIVIGMNIVEDATTRGGKIEDEIVVGREIIGGRIEMAGATLEMMMRLVQAIGGTIATGETDHTQTMVAVAGAGNDIMKDHGTATARSGGGLHGRKSDGVTTVGILIREETGQRDGNIVPVPRQFHSTKEAKAVLFIAATSAHRSGRGEAISKMVARIRGATTTLIINLEHRKGAKTQVEKPHARNGSNQRLLRKDCSVSPVSEQRRSSSC